VDLTALIKAIAQVESGNNPKVKNGDNGKAWGLYQFHKARWYEFSREPWGKASPVEQTRTMKRALVYYLRKQSNGQKEKKERITWAANFHNKGHGSFQETRYTRSVYQYYCQFDRLAGKESKGIKNPKKKRVVHK
jgi:hypothetical protein